MLSCLPSSFLVRFPPFFRHTSHICCTVGYFLLYIHPQTHHNVYISVCVSSIMRLTFPCSNLSYPRHSRCMLGLFLIGLLSSCCTQTYLYHCLYRSYRDEIHLSIVFCCVAYVSFRLLVIDKHGRMSRNVACMFSKLAHDNICVTYPSFQNDAPFSPNHVMCFQTLMYLWNDPTTYTFALRCTLFFI